MIEPVSRSRAPETLRVEAAAADAWVLSAFPVPLADVEVSVKGFPAVSDVMEMTEPEAVAVTASTRLGLALMAAASLVAMAPSVVSAVVTV